MRALIFLLTSLVSLPAQARWLQAITGKTSGNLEALCVQGAKKSYSPLGGVYHARLSLLHPSTGRPQMVYQPSHSPVEWPLLRRLYAFTQFPYGERSRLTRIFRASMSSLRHAAPHPEFWGVLAVSTGVHRLNQLERYINEELVDLHCHGIRGRKLIHNLGLVTDTSGAPLVDDVPPAARAPVARFGQVVASALDQIEEVLQEPEPVKRKKKSDQPFKVPDYITKALKQNKSLHHQEATHGDGT